MGSLLHVCVLYIVVSYVSVGLCAYQKHIYHTSNGSKIYIYSHIPLVEDIVFSLIPKGYSHCSNQQQCTSNHMKHWYHSAFSGEVFLWKIIIIITPNKMLSCIHVHTYIHTYQYQVFLDGFYFHLWRNKQGDWNNKEKNLWNNYTSHLKSNFERQSLQIIAAYQTKSPISWGKCHTVQSYFTNSNCEGINNLLLTQRIH